MHLRLKNKPWWKYLPEDLQESLVLSFTLSKMSASWGKRFHDYSFLVFPAAKAYEGFLKKLFFDLGFISKSDYLGKHFRIGKSLNPDLPDSFRDQDWVYGKLEDFCTGTDLPMKLWDTWKMSRNVLFHWFPEEKNVVSHPEAVERLINIVQVIDEVFGVCRVQLERNGKTNKK